MAKDKFYSERAVEISISPENCNYDNWSDLINLCGEADKEIKQLQAELLKYRGVPVSERLPEIKEGKFLSEKVWCWSRRSYVGVFCYRKNGRWQNANTGRLVSYITHWRPIILPKDEK